MFKSRAATAASSSKLPIEGADQELSEGELTAVLGGQSQPDRGKELSDQFDRTVDVFVDEYLAPIGRQVDAVVKLGYAAENYVRWQFEHTESRQISEERGAQLDAEEREAKENKERQQQEERDHLLEGDKETTPADVAVWLDATQDAPYMGESPFIPSNMINPGPTHEPQIFIEPLDSY